MTNSWTIDAFIYMSLGLYLFTFLVFITREYGKVLGDKFDF